MEFTIDFMELFKKIKLAFLHPKVFFEKSKGEKGLRDALIFFVILLIISTILGLVSALFIYPALFSTLGAFLPDYTTPSLNASSILQIFASSIVFGISLSFIWSFIILVWLRIFKIKIAYEKAYQLYAYSRPSAYILGFLPIIGFAATLYSLYSLMLGTEVFTGINRRKSLTIYALSAVLYVFFFFAIAAIGVSNV